LKLLFCISSIAHKDLSAINSVETSPRNFSAFQNVAKALNGTAVLSTNPGTQSQTPGNQSQTPSGAVTIKVGAASISILIATLMAALL